MPQPLIPVWNRDKSDKRSNDAVQWKSWFWQIHLRNVRYRKMEERTRWLGTIYLPESWINIYKNLLIYISVCVYIHTYKYNIKEYSFKKNYVRKKTFDECFFPALVFFIGLNFTDIVSKNDSFRTVNQSITGQKYPTVC